MNIFQRQPKNLMHLESVIILEVYCV